MQLYAIFTRPKNGLGPVLDTMGPHLDYQKKLEAEGALFAAGPFSDDNQETWQGEGMVIVRAASREAAHAIASEDPMHKSGARTFRIRPWLLNEGSLTLRVTYSNGGRTIE
jgi:uncharacterized protein YciI